MFVLKLLISVTLIAFFLKQIDLHKLTDAFQKTQVGWLIVGLLLYPLGQIVCAIRWQYLARALGIHRELKPMVGLYFIGMFFNLFLPTSIGGDITRGLYLDPNSGKTRISFLSVLAERGTGMITMILLGSIVMLSPYGSTLPSTLRFGFPALSLLGISGLWFFPAVIQNTRTRIRELLFEDLIIFWREPKIGVVAVAYSVVFYSILVAIHVCIARALSLDIPVLYHLITLSVASLAGLLPSFNGIGVRDGAYLYLLGLAGIDQAHGLLFSFLWFLIMALSSSIGCVVYLFRGLSPGTTDSANQELAHAKR